MEKKQDYGDFVKKNHKEMEKRSELLEKQAEAECSVCDQVIEHISSTPGICKGCEDKAINGEKLREDSDGI